MREALITLGLRLRIFIAVIFVEEYALRGAFARGTLEIRKLLVGKLFSKYFSVTISLLIFIRAKVFNEFP